MGDVQTEKIVILEYNDIIANETTPELMKKIEEAYGYDGLGILAIRGIPEFEEKRVKCLPQAYKFGNLPEDLRKKYEHPESYYSFGWSHGKEKLEGKPDFAKGSYYANPVHDRPVDDADIISKYPSFAHPNIWPTQEDCPDFEKDFKACASLVVTVGKELARHCDNYVRSVLNTYGNNRSEALEKVVAECRCHKARLLYYFSVPENNFGAAAEDVSNWCGWHNDHGSLTGLTPAMYFDKQGNQIPCPDPKAGLYIRSRNNKTVRVAVPSDVLAFQIGETAQIHTGGILQATPHCVRAAEVPGVSRGTIAVFMEPEWSHFMGTPAGSDKERILRGARNELMPKGVSALVERWKGEDQTFSEFSDVTLATYYNTPVDVTEQNA